MKFIEKRNDDGRLASVEIIPEDNEEHMKLETGLAIEEMKFFNKTIEKIENGGVSHD